MLDPLEPRQLLAAFSAQINFQPAGTELFPGYTMDRGALFRDQGTHSFGWNVKHSATARDRNAWRSPDQRYDTHNTLTFRQAHWELAVPSGTYQVRIVAGDPLFTKGADNYRITAEGVLAVSGRPRSTSRWLDRTVIVTVTDGRLTISSLKSAVNNKICFIEVHGVTPASGTFQAESYTSAQGVFRGGSAISDLDNNDFIKFSALNFGKPGHYQSVFADVSADYHADQRFEFRLDSPTGTLISAIDVQPTGDTEANPTLPFFTQHADLSSVSGVHDLYIVFKGPTDAASLDSFRFSTQRLTKVLALGDSITEARGGYASYRRYLYSMLHDAGHDHVDFIGSMRGVRTEFGPQTVFDFDQDHEGHSGLKADHILNGGAIIDGQPAGKLSDWLAQIAVPDIVILHVGTNDLIMWESIDSTINDIRGIIGVLRAANPDVKIILSKIIPATTDYIAAGRVEELNQKLVTLRKNETQTGSPIYLADPFTGFDEAIGADTFDGVHPNDSGEQKMAADFFSILDPLL